MLPESEEELLKKSNFQSENGQDEGGTLELPHDDIASENSGNIQEGSQEKQGWKKLNHLKSKEPKNPMLLLNPPQP